MTEEIIVSDMRVLEVKTRIEKISNGLQSSVFDLAELLSEARAGKFHLKWGYGRFGDWLEKASGLDMSERTAFYLMAIIEKAKALEIPREQLKAVKMSKLKEIFTLDTDTQADDIKQLVVAAQQDTLSIVRQKVQEVKSGHGEEPYVFVTYKLKASVKKMVVDAAFETVRKLYGDKKDANGEPYDLSDSGCLELVCADFNVGIHVEEGDEEPIPLEIAI